MAVHKRAYRPYEGPLTEERFRFLVLARYGFQHVFASRVVLAFVVLCYVPFLVEAAAIYVASSPAAKALLRISTANAADPVKVEFFLVVQTIQGVLAFILTAWVAPVLVSPDLVNGALPLFLSRPFSRAEYVLGKATLVAGILSAITWVPGLLLFFLQAGLADTAWLKANWRVPFAMLVGYAVWIVVLTLLGLALSAMIRWRIVASAALFGLFFMGSTFAEAWVGVLRNPWGRVANLPYMIGLVWTNLYGVTVPRPRMGEVPLWAAWATLALVCAASLWILNRRLQAREVAA